MDMLEMWVGRELWGREQLNFVLNPKEAEERARTQPKAQFSVALLSGESRGRRVPIDRRLNVSQLSSFGLVPASQCGHDPLPTPLSLCGESLWGCCLLFVKLKSCLCSW